MFAFVFIDTHTGEFIAARDRLGVKPFYYYYDGQEFRFASELKALLSWPAAPKKINKQVVHEYLFLKYISGSQTIFHNYFKLKPAHFITGNFNNIHQFEVKQYWDIPVFNQVQDKSEKAWIEEFEELFNNSVNIRLRSDVPVGIFLSGGIDSSLVAAFCAKSPSKDQLTAFTVGFNEKEFDESAAATQTAAHIGIKSDIIYLEPAKLNDIDILAKYYDEPFADSSALPSYHLCKAAAKKGTVFLSGDGGDEAFAGYKRYIRNQQYPLLQNLPSPVRKMMKLPSSLLPHDSRLKYLLTKIGTNAQVSKVFTDDLPFNPVYNYLYKTEVLDARNSWVNDMLTQHYLPNADSVSVQQYWDLSLYLPDDILVKMDRASMANSIEVRSPFLDYRMIEFAAAIPKKFLINKLSGKLMLRQISQKYIPVQIAQAKKSGFGVPLNDWFAEKKGYDFLKERINDSQFALQEYLYTSRLNKMADAHFQSGGAKQYGELFWSWMMFDAWAKQYLH